MTGSISDLVIAGGTGDATDVAAVIATGTALPPEVLALFRSKKARIVACRNSVTDFETSLRGVIPRGWEGLGRTWDSVPGTYLDKKKRVIIATIAAAGGRKVTPRGPTTHGAFSLVVHESMHGYDRLGKHRVLQDSRFVAARTADFAALGAYERQDGLAGLEETYAESASRFFGGDPTLNTSWPNLHLFWSTPSSGLVASPLVGLPASQPRGPLGTMRIGAGSTIFLDLRAEGPGGAIGHAALEFPVGDPAHERLAKRLGAQGASIAGGAVEGEALFYPLDD